MAVTLTPRLGITRWSAGTDPPTRAQLDAAHAALDDLVAVDVQGTIGARPAAGLRGRYYYATDTGRFYRDTGAAWVEVSVGSVADHAAAADPHPGYMLESAAATAATLADVALVESAGVSATYARGDHVHAVPASLRGAVLLTKGVNTTSATNTVAETAILTATIPAGTWADDGDTVVLEAFGSLSNDSGAAVNFRFRLKHAGVTLCETANQAIGSATFAGQPIVVRVVMTKAGGLIRTSALLFVAAQIASGPTWTSMGETLDLFAVGISNSGANPTLATNLEFTVQMGTAAAAASANIQSFVVEKLEG